MNESGRVITGHGVGRFDPTQGAVEIVSGPIGERKPAQQRALAGVEGDIQRPLTELGKSGDLTDPGSVRQGAGKERQAAGRDADAPEAVTRGKGWVTDLAR